tara:strand:+ start:479 stop:1036 length:558 start_codon:yes stop_codon:yes gene_type:complete
MNKIIKTVITTSVTVASTFLMANLQANEIDLALGEDSIKISYANQGAFSERSQTNLSYYHHSDNGDLVDFDFLVGEASAKNNVLVGGKAFYLKDDNVDGGGLALGLTGQYELPENFSLQGKVFYAPSMLVVSDLDNYYELEGRVSYKIIPEAEVSVGYRNVAFDIDGGSKVKIQNQAFLALTLIF